MEQDPPGRRREDVRQVRAVSGVHVQARRPSSRPSIDTEGSHGPMFKKGDVLASQAGKVGGPRGGYARAQALSRRRRRQIAKLGGLARAAKAAAVKAATATT